MNLFNYNKLDKIEGIMKIYKIILSLCLISVLAGCDKKMTATKEDTEQVTTTTTEQVETEQSNGITEEEIAKLHIIAEDPNALPAAAKLAASYLENINGYTAEEIRELIAEYDASQIVEEDTTSDNVSMEYRIDTNSQYIGNQLVNTHYLNVLSLSDSVDVDRVEVNRGNCNVQFRNGSNPVGYGEALKFLLNCDPHNVREVKVYLKDGRDLLMTPQ